MAKSAVFVINMTSVQNLLAPFCCVLEKDIYGNFLCLAVLASSSKFHSYLFKIKKLKYKKNFNRTAISRHFPNQIEVIACPMIAPRCFPASQEDNYRHEMKKEVEGSQVQQTN